MNLFFRVFSGLMIGCCALFGATEVEKYFPQYCPGNRQYCRASIRHIEAGGIGYDKGYTTFEAFGARDPREESLIPFLDLRGHVFNDGKFAANIGGGLRKLAGCRVYGVNAYYDFRDTKKLNYNQLGVGLETLGSRWDFRLNGYIPLGCKITAPFDAEIIDFQDHYLMISQQYQLAMDAAQAEFGVHFATSKYFTFYATAGAYYLHGQMGPNVWGGKARFLIQFKEYWTLELSNSYDKIFHDRFQCQLTFTIPLGKKLNPEKTCAQSSCNMAEQLCARMAQPVQRQEIVIIEQIKKCSRAINPDTDQPYYFVFVDNTSHSSGTYESPYPTLALAQANSKAGDIIYVFPGDGTTKGMNHGIVLKSQQNLWGSGISYPITTTQGNFVIPAQSDFAPKITNFDSPAVTLADINQVKGFNMIDVFADYGIVGSNISNIEIAQCQMSNTTGDHIHLVSSKSSAKVVLSDLDLTTAGVFPISLNSSADSTTCIVKDCLIDNNTNGLYFNLNGPTTLSISGNTMTNTTSVSSAPIEIAAGADSLTATISNNTIMDNTCSAIRFYLTDTDTATVSMSNNVISNNGSGSQGLLASPIVISPNYTDSGNCNLTLSGNTLRNNDGTGLYCVNGNFDNFSVTANDNILSGNSGGFAFANDCNTFDLTAKNNTITQGTDHGIGIVSATMHTANITIQSNEITNNSNQASAIAFAHNGIDCTVDISNNTLSSNEGSGVIMYSSSAVIENINATITGNTISHNQNLNSNAAGGIDLEQYTNFLGTVSNNTLFDNATHGMYVGSTDTTPSVCLTLENNSNDTDYVLANGTGTFNLAPCAAPIINSGTITVVDVVSLVQSCPDGASCTL